MDINNILPEHYSRLRSNPGYGPADAMADLDDIEIVNSPRTKFIEYESEEIDNYEVIVHLPEDWEVVHNYIIDSGITCINTMPYSLRRSIYRMNAEQVNTVKSHPKVKEIILEPGKYPKPQSPMTDRYKKNVSFNKPNLSQGLDHSTAAWATQAAYTNGIRSNWSHIFVNSPSSEPWRSSSLPAGKTNHQTDIPYSVSGKNVDAVIIDSGTAANHPEFKREDGTYRAKDLILDGPYYIDPDYFDNNNKTFTKIIDGVNHGTTAEEQAAREWWTDSSMRSVAYQSLGTVSSLNSLYGFFHSQTKTDGGFFTGAPITSGHGTACSSQVGGKTFGLAFECNLWSIRISFGDGYIDASTATDICTIFHNAKKIKQPGDPDPTITNNSYGLNWATLNIQDFPCEHRYREEILFYLGTGDTRVIPSDSGACLNNALFTVKHTSQYGSGSILTGYGGQGGYAPTWAGDDTNSSVEDAIAAGVIVVASAGNDNQKKAHKDDPDFNNWFRFAEEFGDDYTDWICRVTGVQKGFSGYNNDSPELGAIRVGALDCAVEPPNSNQATTAYSVRKVCYSACGPMIDIWAPAEYTMAAGYSGGYESFMRDDDNTFYDTWFNGTSSAGPNTVSVICLYLEVNRKANQQDVKDWLKSHGSKDIGLSDPYPNYTDVGYWTTSYDASVDDTVADYHVTNVRGNSSLRHAPKRVLYNPYANNTIPNTSGTSLKGISFKQS